MLKRFFSAIFLVMSLAACNKNTNGSCPLGLRLTPSDSVLEAGGQFSIYCNLLGLSYQWYGPNNFNYQSATTNSVSFTNAMIRQTGWYYCTASQEGCEGVRDSVYIRVRNAQGSPSCSLVDNQITSTFGLPDMKSATVKKAFSNSFHAMTVTVDQGYGYPYYQFVFNTYNGNSEPQDGIYHTTDFYVFDQRDDADLIYMSCKYSLYNFGSNELGQNVYVSHVNGKLRIAFCSISASDVYGGSTEFTGQVTEN